MIENKEKTESQVRIESKQRKEAKEGRKEMKEGSQGKEPTI